MKPEDDLLILKPVQERTQHDVSDNLGFALTEEAIPAASVGSSGSSVEEDSSEHDTTTPSSSAPPSESGNLDCATHHFTSNTAIADLVPELFTENIMAKVLRTAQAAMSSLPTAFPEIVPQQDNHDGSYSLREADFWTCGFFPGTMYSMLERLIKYPQRMHLSSSVDLKHLRNQPMISVSLSCQHFALTGNCSEISRVWILSSRLRIVWRRDMFLQLVPLEAGTC